MGKLSAQDEAALAALLAKRDTPDDEPAEIWIREGDREYRLTGRPAARALRRLGFHDDDDQDQDGGDGTGTGTPPVKKAARKAVKKAAPPAGEDPGDEDDGEDGEDGEDPGAEQDPGTATKKHWYFS